MTEKMCRKGKKSEGTKQTEEVENRFSKEQLLASERFRDRRDVTEALLAAGKLYTVQAVEEMITEYGKGKVR